MPTTRIILAGDINLLGVEDPAVTFRRVAPTFKAADAVFANLECCLFEPAEKREMMRDDQSGVDGLYAPPHTGEALQLAETQGLDLVEGDAYPLAAVIGAFESMTRHLSVRLWKMRSQSAGSDPSMSARTSTFWVTLRVTM